ncbi:hypothetical protein AVEN_134253-1 [Araneus ventricosus]|uniref:Uncharacterized protein n=1 Tax=Araneus ventricosus TaxID=182803 RepID=A0A4Y2M407_ARAVE|nr:hypothetical protein AVEN_134253-1 [Araneus ventricosus]
MGPLAQGCICKASSYFIYFTALKSSESSNRKIQLCHNRFFFTRGKTYYIDSEISLKAVPDVENVSPDVKVTCPKEMEIPNIVEILTFDNTDRGIINAIIDLNILAYLFKNSVGLQDMH